MNTRTILLLVGALAGGIVMLVQVSGAGGEAIGGSSAPPPEARDYSLKACGEHFAQFNVGSSFRGHALTDNSRICTVAEPVRTVAAQGGIDPDSLGRSNFDSYVYGSCNPKPGQGCAPPLEIQSWPACERSAADYNAGPPGAAHRILPTETLQIRGVPARMYDDGSLEVSTGAVTVVIFGHTRQQVLEAATMLRTEAGAPFKVGERDKLPAPVPGSQDGTLPC